MSFTVARPQRWPRGRRGTRRGAWYGIRMARRVRGLGWWPFLVWGLVWIGVLGGESFASRHTVGWVARALPFLPAAWVGEVEFGFRKVLHFAAYALLGWLVGREAVRRWGGWVGAGGRVAALAGLLVAVALLDEGHQRLVRGRHPSAVDVVLDAAGATAGLVLAVARRR